ncbi:TPA: hypothetical protein MD708_004144 [Citrobacter freundii]|uniref:hypothetical protein n=1 Tax=Enterobacter hormaechei TaxID=158836 RepID=UPI00138F571C|nr:hypothetical protein [Enterobacter hormaechei]HBV8384451.1 hypothetical protein [Citrobacter freundii]
MSHAESQVFGVDPSRTPAHRACACYALANGGYVVDVMDVGGLLFPSPYHGMLAV